ncbi:unnamed protein product [Allacma fusca]|uniref:Uncharacterized protein n=1 Tax=Allacma fusca TaxID=39272 RepID=A0A8J2KZN7_9HEXA|nr:unnamed protein product [Allacma fusca]
MVKSKKGIDRSGKITPYGSESSKNEDNDASADDASEPNTSSPKPSKPSSDTKVPGRGKKKKKVSVKKRIKKDKKPANRRLRDSIDDFVEENMKGLLRSDKDAKVNEVNPELDLLMEADSGQVAEGFSSAAFQKEKAAFVEHMLQNTAPIRYLLQVTGRFPFRGFTNGDGSITYSTALYRPEGLYFVIVSIVVIYFLFIGSFNLVDVMLNLTFGDGKNREEECQEERMFETTIIDRNIVAFASLWTALCHTTLTSVNLFFKRHYMAKYLSFWSLAAQIIHVDVSIGLLMYSRIVVAFYLVIMVVMTILSLVRISARAADLPSLFSILMFRLNFPCLLGRTIVMNEPEEKPFTFPKLHLIFEIISAVCLLFIFISSKVLILYFLHFCRMLTKAFKSWNARFHAVINFPDKFSQSAEGRTTYELLFKDHCTLLSLIEGTDRCFSTIVESYLALQLVSIILETYFVYRTAGYRSEQQAHSNVTAKDAWGGDFSKSPYFIRPFDYIPGIIIMLSNVLILIVILSEAGKISAVAKEGLEVIRRKTMMGRKSNQELWFTLSMYFSYTSQTQLSLQVWSSHGSRLR